METQKQAAEPTPTTQPGELKIKWQQKDNEVAPVLEMRAYLDQLKDAGVAVGAMQFERNAQGKLSGSFGVSYDPNSTELAKLEGAVQGFMKVGNGIKVTEQPEQATARQQRVGEDQKAAVSTTAEQVSQAFGVKQWDTLSAHLSQVPKGSLTNPEVAQQVAGVERIKQIAEKQSTAKTQVVGEGKSLLDVESGSNPASAFLKNFYAHLNGAPKTRTSLEVDYEKTRQELQSRLLGQAGTATGQTQPAAVEVPAVKPEVGAVAAVASVEADKVTRQTKQQVGEQAKPVVSTQTEATKFTASDVPQKVLASLGLSVEELEKSGQLKKLLNGEKSDLVDMRVGAADDSQAVRFNGKMVLHRETDGTATLKMELPKEKLIIPNEIGGQPFTPEQRKQLETQGTAGLMRGLKDEKGNVYNGYVGIDERMNKLVVLPENKVFFKDVIAGVKLSQEQSKDLRDGKAVPLSKMATGDGGKPYDGVAQIMPAKGCIMIKPAVHEQQQQEKQQATLKHPNGQKVEAPKASVAKEKTKVRGPRM